MKYLLDTCVISELVAKQPSEKVIEWIDNIEQENIYLTSGYKANNVVTHHQMLWCITCSNYQFL